MVPWVSGTSISARRRNPHRNSPARKAFRANIFMANKTIPGRVMALRAAPMSVVLSEVDEDDDGGLGGAKGGGGGGAYKTTVVGTTTPSAVTSERPDTLKLFGERCFGNLSQGCAQSRRVAIIQSVNFKIHLNQVARCKQRSSFSREFIINAQNFNRVWGDSKDDRERTFQMILLSSFERCSGVSVEDKRRRERSARGRRRRRGGRRWGRTWRRGRRR